MKPDDPKDKQPMSQSDWLGEIAFGILCIGGSAAALLMLLGAS